MTDTAWVADVGGTWTRCAVVDRLGAIRAEHRVQTAGLPDPPDTWVALADTWRTLTTEPPVGVAIALPARIAADGCVTFIPNVPSWAGSNPVTGLANAVGRPADALQDAQAGLRGEAWMGRDVPASFYFMAIGTGIGGAYQVDGHPVRGDHNLAGIPASVLPGRHIEDVASGRAVAAALDVPSGEAALALARTGDPAALAAFAIAADALRGVVAVITGLLDVSEVRVGGGFGTAAFDLLFPTQALPERYWTYPPVHADVRIRPSDTADQAQLLGLAATVFTPDHL